MLGALAMSPAWKWESGGVGKGLRVRDISPGLSPVAAGFYLPFQVHFKIWENVDVLPTGEIC